jgi:hypothetical protein
MEELSPYDEVILLFGRLLAEAAFRKLISVSQEDNGKVFMVIDGKWQLRKLPESILLENTESVM